MDQGFNGLSAEIGRWRVKEVLVDISEHASRGLEVVVCSLKSGLVTTILGGSMAG
jgi:hypothetical protein